TAAAATAAAARRAAVGIVGGRGGRRRRHDFAQQRLVLQLVEVAGGGIAAGGLPALDHRAGVVIEGAGDLGIETEPVETALHVAALTPVETDLVFRQLAGFLAEGGRIDGGDVARHILAAFGRRAAFKRGDPRQRQRPELAVRIGADIGVELFRLL